MLLLLPAWHATPRRMSSEESRYQLSPGMWARLGYQVFDAEGEVVETGASELSCLIGYGVLFPALEEKLEGLTQGASRTVLLRPELTFGLRNPDAQVEVERSEFPGDVAAGDCYEAEDEDGRPVLLQVLDVTEEGVVVDSNHPLAGQILRFEVEAREVRPATEGELSEAEQRLLSQEHEPEALITPERLLRGPSRR
jgi:FKBP-type peptidyl-prolyl cis-trans isomerase SlyD